VIESVKQQLELKKKTLTVKQKKLNNFSLGEKGEQLACDYLVNNKYQIINKNIRVKNNEIDIIAHDHSHNELVFIEVKTRSSDSFGTPAMAVTKQKLNSMNFVARNFLKQHDCNLDYRFDIIAISYFRKGINTKPKIEHFESVTW
jgi:putative endonuclease